MLLLVLQRSRVIFEHSNLSALPLLMYNDNTKREAKIFKQFNNSENCYNLGVYEELYL